MSIDLILCGASGRLGSEIVKEIENHPSIKLAGCISSKNNKSIGEKISVLTNSSFDVELKSSFEGILKPDVILDVSSPNFFDEIVNFSKSNEAPLIVASTGHDDEQISMLKKLSESIPIMIAPNLSMGINYIKNFFNSFSLTSLTNDIEIHETHHKNKIDSPSGTALDLKDLFESKKEKLKVSIKSYRDDDSVGTHKIILNMHDETIEITHLANSRKIFAIGAITAIKWIHNQKPGLYSLSNI